MDRESQKVDTKMNMKKTKVLFNNFIRDHEIKIHDDVIECFQNYIYLGQKISVFPSHEKEIKRKV